MTAVPAATTAGTLLDGRVRYEQLATGYRTGIEPVFLAASVPARSGDRVLEGGTGAGAALLCLLARVPGVAGLGVERDPLTAAMARRNAAQLPGLSIYEGALEDLPPAGPFDHACANPPWHHPAGTAPQQPRRRDALQAAETDVLDRWSLALCRHLRPGGTITLVLSARLLVPAVTTLHAAGAGAVRVRPLLPRAGRAAKIVLVHGVNGAAPAEARVLPGLVLHRDGPGYTDEAERILRAGAALPWTDHLSWTDHLPWTDQKSVLAG